MMKNYYIEWGWINEDTPMFIKMGFDSEEAAQKWAKERNITDGKVGWMMPHES